MTDKEFNTRIGQLIGHFLNELKVALSQLNQSRQIAKDDLWISLLKAGEFDLIQRLSKVESKQCGYESIVVPTNGFCRDNDLNEKIISWLKKKRANIINVKKIVEELQACQSWAK